MIKVTCFAQQGFGNDLLHELSVSSEVEICTLYTKKQLNKFEYYSCECIVDLAKRLKIPVIEVPDTGYWECQYSDLAIVSSFHRIFKKKHLNNSKFTINIHPSVLPAYRGSTPTNWMIKNKEKIVGVTAHLMDEGIDSGDILFQQRILNPYLADNDLRKALSFASRKIIREVVESYPIYSSDIEKKEEGSFHHKRMERDSIIKLAEIRDLEELIFHIKAFTNFPMPKIDIHGRLFEINYNFPQESVEIQVGKDLFIILGKWLS